MAASKTLFGKKLKTQNSNEHEETLKNQRTLDRPTIEDTASLISLHYHYTFPFETILISKNEFYKKKRRKSANQNETRGGEREALLP